MGVRLRVRFGIPDLNVNNVSLNASVVHFAGVFVISSNMLAGPMAEGPQFRQYPASLMRADGGVPRLPTLKARDTRKTLSRAEAGDRDEQAQRPRPSTAPRASNQAVTPRRGSAGLELGAGPACPFSDLAKPGS